MRIRFGYVAMSATLKDCSPSKTITLKSLAKLDSQKARFGRLLAIAKQNIANTQRLLYHNKSLEIKVFRITSKLIPFATHPVAEDWDWFKDVKDELYNLGSYAKKHKFRISAHPDHFTLINSTDKQVIANSIKDLEYHHKIFEGMGLDYSAKLVIHVGGSYKNKLDSANRFINNFNSLDVHLKNRIILENDDKIYTARDVLDICKKVNAPMVLDIHHDWCNNDNNDITKYLPEIFSTWSKESIPPKIHLSSPKDKKNFRSHADYVDSDFFISFLEKAKNFDLDFDVMIEAKKKDEALIRLVNDLKKYNKIKLIDGSTIEY